MKRRPVITALVTLATASAITLIATPAQAVPVGPAVADPAGAAAAAADSLVAGNPAFLHKGAGDKLTRVKVQAGGNGMQFVSYERTYRGLPVVGGDAVVVTNSAGAVLHTAAAQSAVINVGTAAKVSAADALATSRAQLAIVDEASTPRLVVLAWGTPRLAWETIVAGAAEGRRASKLHVFVDALTGQVTDSYDEVREGTGNSYYVGTVSISTSGSGSSFSMSDPTRSGIRCGGQNGSTYTGSDDVWGNGSGTNLETACVDVLYDVQREWDMLSAWLGRNGINGSGSGFPARVGLNDVNAYWNGSYTNFGHSQDGARQATSIDVVAHEFGHAIFQTTPGGAGSGNENGGINESTGDIFGALTEAYANNPNDPPDFTVGEEVNLVGNGPIRYMYNPSLIGDPNCYSSAIPNTEVHAAAGPLNHWFYLASQGSNPSGGPSSPICSGGPSSVTGVGIQNAGKIYYNAMLAKTSTWRYRDIRVATLNAAKNLFPGSCTEFNRVKDAWNAISVPAQSGEPTCSTSTNDFSISVSPTSRSVTAGSSTTATVSTAVTSGSAQTVSLSASGLPSGASASFSPSSVTAGNSSTMTITTSGSTPSGTYTVTITGTGSVTHTTPFSLTVTGGGGGGCSSPGQKLGNPGFESGSSPWTATSGVIGSWSGQSPHSGTRFAWLNGYGSSNTNTLYQNVSIPAGCSATLSFWLHIDSSEYTSSVAYDTMQVQVRTTGGSVLATLATYSNLDEASGYQQRSFNVSAYAGQTIQIRFTGTEDYSLQTSFVIDDTALTAS